MTDADNDSPSAFAARANAPGHAFRPATTGRVTGVPTHSPPPGVPLTPGQEVTAVGFDERWPGYVLCGSLQGHSGWVPASVLAYLGPGIAVVREDYKADVLSVAIGDVVTLQAEANGWYWAAREDGRAGWLLAAHVERLEND